MSEREVNNNNNNNSHQNQNSNNNNIGFGFVTQTLKTLTESTKLIINHKTTFLSIFFFTTLPLSLLLSAAAISSRPRHSRVAALESLARAAATRFEARHVLRDSRDQANALLLARAALFLLPSLALSLPAAVSAVSSAAAAFSGKPTSPRAAVSAVFLAWRRPLVTAIVAHALLLACTLATRTLAAASGGDAWAVVVAAAAEIYVMAVASLAIVVSVVEERFGIDAIRVGSGLMEGRRVGAWVLSGLFVLATGFIAGGLGDSSPLDDGGVMDGRDLPGMLESATVKRVLATIGDKIFVVVLYGVVVLMSYVVFTVFYCECCSSKRRLGNRGESETEFVTLTV